MESLPVWLIPTITLVGGILIGVILARILQASSPQGAQQQLKELQERFDSYQKEVVSNFGVTAELFNKFNQSYQDVQEHLQHSAERLATDEKSRELLLAYLDQSGHLQISPPDVEPPQPEEDEQPEQAASEEQPSAQEAPEQQEQDVEPPKDYAPKQEGEPGTLDENFGLKK